MKKHVRRPPGMRAEVSAPHAAMLIESMRDIGYSLESALADIIDNSISGGASAIELFAETGAAQPRLAILDDGRGMDEAELLEAMRPGNRSPLDRRAKEDLGRFGLGLKTASFSQCRRLTVISRKGRSLAAACWDLDYVAEVNDWMILIPENPESLPWAEKLRKDGTLVLWEQLDRLVGEDSGKEFADHLVQRLDDAVTHLELVFHRFLSGEKGSRRIRMSLNNRALSAFDPFHSSHPATISGQVELVRVRGRDVAIQAFTLPHHKKVTPADWERYAGRAGYTRNQGFYLYRGRRLIIHGTWFGLARQTELTKLARVRVDVPNDLDDEWKIDVRKSSAQPPPRVRARLRRLIESIGAGSKRVYTSRGRRLVSDTRVPAWQRIQDKNEIRYRVNDTHPIVSGFQLALPESLRSGFREVLELIGAGLPVDTLFADMGSNPEQVSGIGMSPSAFEHSVKVTAQQLLASGIGLDAVKAMMKATEPFRSDWETAASHIEAMNSNNDE